MVEPVSNPALFIIVWEYIGSFWQKKQPSVKEEPLKNSEKEFQKVEELWEGGSKGAWSPLKSFIHKGLKFSWSPVKSFLWEDFFMKPRAFGGIHVEWCKTKVKISIDPDSYMTIWFCPPVHNRLYAFSKYTLNCHAFTV